MTAAVRDLHATTDARRATGGAGKVGGLGVSRHDHFTADRMHGDGIDLIRSAATQIGRLQQAGEGRVQAADKAVLTAAVRDLHATADARRATGGAG